MNPRISVIMSLYNTPEKWLREAIDSVLNQSYKDFEFIIYEDCPTDNSEYIVDDYQTRDNRIVVIKNTENRGLTRNLYDAVNMARGEYIARMDSDDICVLNRFEKQIEYMDSNPEVAVVGSYTNVFSENFNTIGMIDLDDDMEVTRIRMLFSNAGVAHPSAFIRKSFLEKNNINYDCEYKKSQDFGLWSDIINHMGVIRVIPEILMNYRVHDNQISNKNKVEQNDCAKRIILRQLSLLIDEVDNESFCTHMALYSFDYSIPKNKYVKYIKLLISNNKSRLIYNPIKLKKELLMMWNKNILKALKKFKLNYLFSLTSIRALFPDIIYKNYFKISKKNKYKKILNEFLEGKKHE